MRKKLKSKVEGADVLAVCRTKEEQLIMLILIVYCQHFYRKFKREKKSIDIARIIAAARHCYHLFQMSQPAGEKSEVIWS